MPDPYYCKLYIDTDDDVEKLEAALKDAADDAFADIGVEYPVFDDDNFDPTSHDKRHTSLLIALAIMLSWELWNRSWINSPTFNVASRILSEGSEMRGDL